MVNSADRAHTEVAERLQLLPIHPRILEFREDPCSEPDSLSSCGRFCMQHAETLSGKPGREQPYCIWTVCSFIVASCAKI